MPRTTKSYNTIIIGGGFYGLRIALYLRQEFGIKDILILEKEDKMMSRASYVNQARVHNGYHYPRSVLTALRSRVNFPVFVEEYGAAIVNSFDKYYAVAKKLSKVNARQFELFCKKIGAEIAPVNTEVKKKFNPYLVDDVFRVKEYAFDSWKARDILMAKIDEQMIERRNGEEAIKVSESAEGIAVKTNKAEYRARRVINCGYSQINKINRASNLPLVPYKHEIAEMCLVKLPKGMENFSVTVMDGPFFSIMPFPTRGLSTLSHVRYTPHTEWRDNDQATIHDPHDYFSKTKLKSNYPQMYADVIRYIPVLKDMTHEDSIWEVKTVLMQSEDDDSRPILFKPNLGFEGYTCIMGGKFDNIYDVLEELKVLYGK
jgi:glycine/D-amino acid oxidase-like deaminating enzyme